MTLNDIRVGDIVQIDCPSLISNIKTKNPVEGIVIQVFDKLFKDGSEGNLEIDIRIENYKWIRYIPSIDGGSISVIKRI